MSPLEPDSVFEINPSVSYQPAGEGAVILRISDGQLYTCNATSETFLRYVDGTRTLGAIAAEICKEFEVDLKTVTGDLSELARELIDEGILRRIE